MDSFDLIVIGAGPGGYVCAFRAAQLGLKVALVDQRATLGGTCLNVGCIPSKALLHSSEHVTWAKQHAKDHGINLGSVDVDLAAFMKRKDEVVNKLVGGVGQLAKARKITVLTGTAEFTGPKTIRLRPAPSKSQDPGQQVQAPAENPNSKSQGATEITATHIVIATGSAPVELPFMKFDGTTIVSSDHAIAFTAVPRKLVVVGGGAIGLELGSVWSRLGSDVTILEFLPKIVANYDDDIVRTFTRILQKQGLKIEVNTKVTGFELQSQNAKLEAAAKLFAERDGKKLEFPADKVLVSVGRRPYTDGLGLEQAGVQLDEKKRIKVDAHLRTNVTGIWAIGDVVAGPMLAHKAEEDGVAAAEWIAGKHGHINWDLVPAIVYTGPEVASVGLGEDGAKAKGIAVNVGKFNLAANGRAIAAGATDGFVKIIADAKTDRILGAQILGNNAGELISEVVTHMEYGGSAEDLGRTIHGHPTMSEAVKEAGLAVSKSAIHAL
jgi:dihydrolipoamide dehydrogenase